MVTAPFVLNGQFVNVNVLDTHAGGRGSVVEHAGGRQGVVEHGGGRHGVVEHTGGRQGVVGDLRKAKAVKHSNFQEVDKWHKFLCSKVKVKCDHNYSGQITF